MANVTVLKNSAWDDPIGDPIKAGSLRETEQIVDCCTKARRKIEIGDYGAGCRALASWWKLGEWPIQHGIEPIAAAELLLTAGSLTDSMVRANRMAGGQRQAEALISGAIALFDQFGEKKKAIEARIELGCCYYHQGLFDIAHFTLRSCADEVPLEDFELKAVALIRLAIVERHSGRLREALTLLEQVSGLEKTSAWTKGRFRTEMANTLKAFGVAEGEPHYFDYALSNYEKASFEFEQVGNLRYVAAVENNRGHLLLSLKHYSESKLHLKRARTIFNELGDAIGCAQVDETLAQLFLASQNYNLAERAIAQAVDALEGSGEDALLAEALATQGLIFCRLGHRNEAKPIIERARRLAERCGDREGAGRALLILIEEMCEQLADDERREIGAQANQLLANSQQHATREQLVCLRPNLTAFIIRQ